MSLNSSLPLVYSPPFCGFLSIRTHENELRVLKDEGHENTIAYAEAEAQLEGLRQEYAASGDEVKKLEGQCTSLQRAM